MNKADDRYNWVAQSFHWIIAALIAMQYVLASSAGDAEEAGLLANQLAALANHKSIGITILALAILRLLWRLSTTQPSLPPQLPDWQAAAAKWTHYLFYLLLLLLPLSGWLGSSASAYSVSWFNLYILPDFVGPDPDLKDFSYLAHYVMATLLFLLFVLHLGAALKHHFLNRDGVLTRMFSLYGALLFTLLVVLAYITLMPTASTPPGSSVPESSRQPENLTAIEHISSELPLWQVDYQSSHLRFQAIQAGATFEGVFKNWSAKVQLDPVQLEQSRIDVSIDLGSVDTRDGERNSTLLSDQFFAVQQYPEARFITEGFAPTGASDNKYSANAQLSIKGKATPIKFDFELIDRDGLWVLIGSSRLDRIALGVGTGQWLDTTWIGQHVDVSVELIASPGAD